jgi:DNA-binding SARP family transcriptional activator
MNVEVRILGPLEVVADGRALELDCGRRERLVLALLAARAPHRVSTAQLIDDLWGQAPKDGAAVTLRSYVSRLREALHRAGLPGLVATRPGGYALTASGGVDVSIDTEAFAERCRQAELESAHGQRHAEAKLLRQALERWRGPALVECAAVRSLAARIEELEQAKLLAWERWAEAGLACGEHDQVAIELAPLIAEHALRERLWASQMLALYRCGRQAEALAAYRELHGRLRELALEPSTSLRELELAILNQDPALDGASAGADAAIEELPRQLRRSAEGPFVGRDEELSLLQARWSLSLTGARQLVVLTGEPGVGKTRLAAEWARRAQALGAQVLYGRCDPVAASPYQPLLSVLEPFRSSSEALAVELSTRRRAPRDAETARAELFDAVVELVAAIADRRALLLVLEDMHWADRSSLALLSHLVSALQHAPLLLLATCRDEPSHRNEQLSRTLAQLRGEPSVTEHALGGLSEAQVGALLAESRLLNDPAAAARLARELHGVSAGNPLFVRQMLAHLASSGTSADASSVSVSGFALRQDGEHVDARVAGEPYGPPAAMRDVIARRLAQLPQQALPVLRLAAVIGPEFELRLLELAGAGGRLLDGLEAAERARLVALVGEPARERYAFAHELIRVALLESIGAARRARLHERVAAALERDHSDGAPSIVLARHYAAAARPGFVAKAGVYAIAAAREALDQFAFHEAAEIASRGIDCLALDESAHAPLRCELQLLLGRACMQDRDVQGGKLAAQRAGQLARELGDRVLLIRAAVVGSYLNVFGEEDEPTARLCADAADVLGDGEDAAAAEVYAGWADYIASSECAADRAEPVSTLALAAARRSGSPAALSRALFIHGEVLGCGERIDERERLAQALLRHGARELDVRAQANGLHQLALVQLERAELERFDATFARLQKLCERAHWWFLDMFCVLWRGMRAMLADELSAVEPLTEELLSHAGGSADVTNLYLGQLFTLRREQRRSGELLPALDEAVRLNPGVSAFRCALAIALSEAGDSERARAELSLLIADDFALIGRDMTWSTHVASIAEVAASVRDRHAAAIVWPRLLPYGGTLLVGSKGMASYGAADRLIGWLAATLGDFEESERRFDAAVRLERRIGSRLLVARTKESWASALRLRGGVKDARRATRLRKEALETLAGLGVSAPSPTASA